MLLKQLINNLPKKIKNLKIKGLETNSKNIQKGFIFFAIRGYKVNGEKYIAEAVKKGANVIICSTKCKFKNENIVVIKTRDIRYLLSEVSSKFYSLKPKNIIAVTGTNGKTSVADLYYQILMNNNIPVASIGTLGIKYKKKIIKSDLTSPTAIHLHRSLEKIKKNKINNVIIETSSHGLHQKRLDHINFQAGIFTNFSQDHLDYHKTMRMYLNAKLYLFKYLLKKRKKIICDSFIKQFTLLRNLSKKKELQLIDSSKIENKLKNNIDLKFNEFQLKNLSMAIAAAKLCGLREHKIFKSLKKIKDINGRLELVRTFYNNIKVYVDFAHTPDALKKTLRVMKKHYGGNVSIVFGCGGDRDFKKRPIMGSIADSMCKKIYVTDDNPRSEDPKKIRKEIIKNIRFSKYFNIGNRANAIKTAITNAEPNELILVAGKGHEAQQIYKNRIIPISDSQIIKKIKIKTKKLSNKKQTFIQNKKILESILINKKVKNFHGLAIDSRVIKKNNIFLTIKGKNHDGTKFISQALKKGAKYIVSSKKINKNRKSILKTVSEIKFLNSFASKKREKTNAKIIAITGSSGKTSLKDLVKDLLQNFGNTYCSPKSYNNKYGVPLSLSHINTSHKYCVFEVGMSKKGEINNLTKLIKPQIGIITNISEAHIENFKNINGIAHAKSEIINNIQKNGTVILNRDDKFFHFLEKKAKINNLKVVTFGLSKSSDICLLKISNEKKNKVLTIKTSDQTFKIRLNNINYYNVLSSLALIKELDLNFSKILNFYKKVEPTEGRGKVHEIIRYRKKFKLIDESYNANPLSVKNAIENLNSIKKVNFKKYLLLGDMLELGDKSVKLHNDLSRVINNSDIDKVFIKGSKTLNTYKNIKKNKRGNILQHDEDIDFTLKNIISNNDYLMIKGSNATGLNNLSKKIIKGY